MVPTGAGSGSGGGSGAGVVVVAADQVGQPIERAAGQRRRVVPAFAEDCFEVGDRRSAHGQLDVVPGRRWAVDRGHRLGLRIPGVVCTVAAAVTQVDATDERDVEFRAPRMTQHDEFLVVRSARSDPHVPQALTTGGLDLLTEMPVLLFAEREPVKVRAPHQPLDHHSSPGRVREDPRDLGARPVEELVGITAPIGEQQQVTGRQRLHAAEQFGEVRLPMNQGGDIIAGRERQAAGVPAVQHGERIAPLGRTEEPLAHAHGDIEPRAAAMCGARLGHWPGPASAEHDSRFGDSVAPPAGTCSGRKRGGFRHGRRHSQQTNPSTHRPGHVQGPSHHCSPPRSASSA